MLTNAHPGDEVIANLELDPRIPGSTEIAVSADGGIDELRGKLESFDNHRAEVNDAPRIGGIHGVDDELEASELGCDHREDDGIRGAAGQVLGHRGPVEPGHRQGSGRLSHPEGRRQLPVRERRGL
jgi:hypothetical protein